MLKETLADRYSQALYGMAQASGDAGQQLRELELVEQVLQKHGDLRRALETPTLPKGTKKEIVKQLFTGKLSPRTINFLYLVVDKQRESFILDIVESFRQKLKADEGIVDARVEVAGALDPSMEMLIKTRLLKLTGKKVNMKIVVNPDLIAGALITIGDRLYDGSMKNHLDVMRERMSAAH